MKVSRKTLRQIAGDNLAAIPYANTKGVELWHDGGETPLRERTSKINERRRYGSKRCAILQAVRSGIRTAPNIAEKIGLPRATVSDYLGRMCRDGEIRRTGLGAYKPKQRRRAPVKAKFWFSQFI